MRRPLGISLALVLVVSAATARAGGPDPGMSFCVLSPPTFPCHYVSAADGAFVLTVTATILDAGGAPVPFVPSSCTLLPKGGTLNFCSCCPNPQFGLTGAAGVVIFTFSAFGGRGLLDILVEAAGVTVCIDTIEYTSPDLNGSCQAIPFSATTVVDLGIWAGAFPPNPFAAWADYDCGGFIGIADLGVWAGGLGDGCGLVCP
jgi:hypothetical protein